MSNRIIGLAIPLLAFGIAACHVHKIQTIRYSGIDIRVGIASAAQVDAHCKKYVKKNDRGEPITGRINACTIRKANGPFIWLAEDKLDRLAHELCHAVGDSPDVCDGVHPERYH